jgi:hypothetical protein
VIDEIAGHEVHGALDPLELSADRSGESPQDRGLSNTDVAFEENVSASEQCDIDQSYGFPLTENGLAYFFLQAQCPRTPVVKLLSGDHRFHPRPV